MSRQLEAIFEQGVLRPLEPLSLAEHQLVRLTLEEKPERLSWESGEPVNERIDEMRWLAQESHSYAGEWVALDGQRLVSHGRQLAEVIAAANAAGIRDPFLASIPKEKDLPFAGW